MKKRVFIKCLFLTCLMGIMTLVCGWHNYKVNASINPNLISGENHINFRLNNVVLASNAQNLLVSNSLAPSISSQPKSVKVTEGDVATFSVEAENATTYYWQYRENEDDYWKDAGITEKTLSITATKEMSGYEYRCLVGNADFTFTKRIESDIAVLSVIQNTSEVKAKVLAPIIFTKNPKTQKVVIGETATFEAEALNATSYKWQYKLSGSDEWLDADSSIGTGYDTNTLEVDTSSMTEENNLSGMMLRCVGANSSMIGYLEKSDIAILSIAQGEFVYENVKVEELTGASMIMKWNIPEDNTTIKLPITGGDFKVDFGDGTTERTTESYYSHTYASAGEYLITLTGYCPYIGYVGNEEIGIDSDYYTFTKYLTEVISWGEVDASIISFSRCENLKKVANDYTENTFKNLILMEDMFFGCEKLESIDLSYAKLPEITSFARMFMGAKNIKSINLNGINSDSVIDMQDMFKNCETLEELYIDIDTSNVKFMNGMFNNCKSLTALDVSSFDTSKVTKMSDMFSGSEKLVNLYLNNFDTRNVTEMNDMFANCSSLKELTINKFNTSNVENMSAMFKGCSGLEKLDIRNFDTSNVYDMGYMFNNCTSLTKLDLSNFDTSNVNYMNYMFSDCKGLNSLDLSGFATTKVSDMSFMFNACNNLSSILLSNKFVVPSGNANMFNGTSNLSAIILIDAVPTANQFRRVISQMGDKVFYVPTIDAETAYETSWIDHVTADKIRPILELVGEKKQTLTIGDSYEEEYYTVAGFGLDRSGDYTVYGYNAIMAGDVNSDMPGTYNIDYDLLRYQGINTLEIMFETREVKVEDIIIAPPTNFEATDGLEENVIVVSWRNSEDETLKYELWYRTVDSDWILISTDARSEFNHTELEPSTSYEYRIRAYDNEGFSSEFVYATGSTILKTPSDDVVLDTIKPLIEHDSNIPDREYSRATAKIEILFNVIDQNYYENYVSLNKEDIIVKIGETSFDVTDISLFRNKIESGEQFKFVINEIPYHTERGELCIIIPADKIKDKALNGNLETIIDTGVTIVNSNITTNAPTLELDEKTNEVTVTCNQVTDFMPDDVTIIYEYRKSGDTEFIKSESNVLTNLAENTEYEIRTVLTDITGNEVASEISTIKTIYLPVEVSFSVTSPESGTYVAGTNVEIIAQFNVNTIIESVPTLEIKFGDGSNIVLNGTFNSGDKQIVYNYTIKEFDLGKLEGANFNGSLTYADGELKEYDIVPEILGNEIYARTGAILSQEGVDTYYPTIQDAINAASENIEAEVTVLINEELKATIEIPENKNIVLDLNGKDVSITGEDVTAIINNGTLKIIEEIGTGEIIALGTNTSKAIVNNGTLDITGGMIYANLDGKTTGAVGIYNEGTLTIGEDDGDISNTVPLISGAEYGVQNVGFGTINFNDGVIEGARDKSYDGVLKIPTGYDLITERIANNRDKTYISTDKIPPVLTYQILTPGWQKEFVEIEITATDEESGVRLVTIDNEEVALIDSKTIIRLEENKEYILYAEDNASNSTSESLRINTIDKIPPKIISITASETDQDGIIELLIEAQDFESGLFGIILKETDEEPADEEEWITFEGNPTSKQHVTVQIEKNKTYYCFAKDAVGNITKYREDIEFEYIDKIAPIIESVKIVRDEGKDFVSGKVVTIDVRARDNIGVEEILISDVDLTEDEAKLSSDWQKFSNKLIHELPIEGDKVYTIYVWVKDKMGNISKRETASAELKALVVGDNELDYVGDETLYNKTSLRFRVKDYHFDFENGVTNESIILRLTSGDKVLRNIITGLNVNKISDYDGSRENDFEYLGEVYELEMENMPGTGKVNLVMLAGTHEDLARNEVVSEVRETDMFIDNNAPEIFVTDTGRYEYGFEIREIKVIDNEGYRVDLVEVLYDGVLETYELTNGRVEIPAADGAIITAYDKAGNETMHEIGATVKPEFTVDNADVKLQYGGSMLNVGYTYKGDGAIKVTSSDTGIVNVALDPDTNKVTLSPVSVGFAEVTLSSLKTENYTENKVVIRVEVNPLPVILSWNESEYDYNGKSQKVEATVENVVPGDSVAVNRYKNSNKVNAGKYVAEAVSLTNNNYTVTGGTNITWNWEIKKINRSITLSHDSLEIEMPRKATISFVYTGEKADAEAIVSDSNVISAVVTNYENSGEIEISSIGVGKSGLTVRIPESTNYNAVEEKIDETAIEVTLKVWLVYDVQGGIPITGKWVTYGRPYGTLPTPEKAGDKFAGWYSEPEGKGNLVTEDTIVTATDKHSIYACWNQPPAFDTLTVSTKTTTSLTISVKAIDPDEDNVRYRIYVDGRLVHTSGYVAHNTIYSYTVTGLTEDTPYNYYVIADDAYEETQSETKSERTKCSGTGYTCYNGVYCQGFIWKEKTCTNESCIDGQIITPCVGGGYTSCTNWDCDDGIIYDYCYGGSERTCSSCDGYGRCPDSPVQVGTSTAACPSCSGTRTTKSYKCYTCNVTGRGVACNGTCGYWFETQNHGKACSSCGGDGVVTRTCGHGEVDGHNYSYRCSTCGGDDEIPYYCEHDSIAAHDVITTCPTCGGDRIEDYKDYPCEHGWEVEHYHCATHDYNGDTSRHPYCKHGETEEHE